MCFGSQSSQSEQSPQITSSTNLPCNRHISVTTPRFKSTITFLWEQRIMKRILVVVLAAIAAVILGLWVWSLVALANQN